jgi:16S rRNA processing protein RimM
MAGEPILMGVVGRPHGVRGLVHVQSYTAAPADLDRYNPLVDELGRAWNLAWRGEGVAELRDAAGRPVTGRPEAEKLTNMRLFVTRDRLPAVAEDEFYLADLVGLTARRVDGTPFGRVGAVHDYGAGTFLDIAQAGAANMLVPFTRAAVPHVDLAAGCVTIAPPEELELREDAA